MRFTCVSMRFQREFDKDKKMGGSVIQGRGYMYHIRKNAFAYTFEPKIWCS